MELYFGFLLGDWIDVICEDLRFEYLAMVIKYVNNYLVNLF